MSVSQDFKLTTPLPKYRSTETLVKSLIDYITTGGFEVGSKFLMDRDLVLITGRSRTTIRRALDILQEEGWITRHGGKGTYISERLRDYRRASSAANRAERHWTNHESLERERTADDHHVRRVFPRPRSSNSLIRVAVAFSGLISVETKYHWYHSEILDGIDEAAAELNAGSNIVMEFLGKHGTRAQSLVNRFEKNRPDVFLCIGPPYHHVELIGLAKSWDIPCVLAAVRAPELELPNLYEDSVTAACDAVKYLASLGHQQIGFVQVMNPTGWWAFDRYEGYMQGVRECNLSKTAAEGLWLPLLPNGDSIAMLRQYIKKHKITALISGAFWAVGHLAELVRKHEIQIPNDLSCVTFDQSPVVKYLLGGIVPTTIHLPWKTLGKTFVQMVPSLINREEIPMNVAIPCYMTEGETTISRSWDCNT